MSIENENTKSLKNTEKKEKSSYRKIMYILLVVIIIIAAIMFLFNFSSQLNSRLEQQTGLYLKESSSQSAERFNYEIENVLDSLSMLASYVSTYDDITSPNVMAMLEAFAEGSSFNEMGVSKPDGNMLLFGGPVQNRYVYNNTLFQSAISGVPSVSEAITSEVFNSKIIIFAVPILKNDLPQGILSASYTTDAFCQLTNLSTFSGQGYSYIVEKNGDVIVSPSHPDSLDGNNGNILDKLSGDGTSSAEIERIKRDMLSNASGISKYTYGGTGRYLSYAPTAYNGWYIMTIIPESVVTSQVTDLKSFAFQLIIEMAVLFCALLLYIIFAHHRSAKALKKSHAETLRNESRYRLLLEHSNDMFFDWDVENNSGFFSKKWIECFGRASSPLELPSDISFGKDYYYEMETVHELDSEKYTQYMDSLFSSAPMDSLEYRRKRQDGEYIWVLARYTPLYNESGQVSRLIGTLTNITKEHDEKKQLIMSSLLDSSTKLYNRAAFEKLSAAYFEADKHQGFAAFFLIDFDNFKLINDTQGHPYGDKTLKIVSKRIKTLFRNSDLLSRMGGDEFAILMKDINAPSAAIEKATEIVELFHKINIEENVSVTISCSVGLSIYPLDGTSFTVLYEKADIALYNTKKNGKNGYTLFTDISDDTTSS